MAQTNDSQEQVTINVETLQPVTRTLMTIGALPTSYLISMTYEEQLLWLQNYLIKTVIPAINNNAEATQEVQDIVMALQDYINDYFNNLDVQEEVSIKIDELIQDGTLQAILLNYTQITKVFDTYNDMMLDTSTYVNGMKLKTLGYHFINDGGGADYIVTNVQNDNKYQVSIGTNLWIELILKDEMNIKQFGLIETDSQNNIADLINAVISKATFTLIFSNINININKAINLVSNLNLKLINTTITHTSTSENQQLFNFIDIENVKISGINSTLKFTKPATEQQFILRMTSAKNIEIDGLILIDAGGDAISLSGYSDEDPLSNIIIKNCDINNNRRNGISAIGGVNGVLIENCKIRNTSGGSVQYGIDIEIWKNDINNKNITIKNCIFEGNVQGGIDVHGNTENILIENNIFNSNNILSPNDLNTYPNRKYPLNLVIKDNVFSNTNIYIRGTRYATIKLLNNTFNTGHIYCDGDVNPTSIYTQEETNKGSLLIQGNIIKDSNQHAITLLYVNNVIVSNNYIYDSKKRAITLSNGANINVENNIIKNYCLTDNTLSVINVDLIKNLSLINNIIEGTTILNYLIQTTANVKDVKILNNDCSNAKNITTFLSWSSNTLYANNNIFKDVGNYTNSYYPTASKYNVGQIINSRTDDNTFKSFVCVYDDTLERYKWLRLQ